MKNLLSILICFSLLSCEILIKNKQIVRPEILLKIYDYETKKPLNDVSLKFAQDSLKTTTIEYTRKSNTKGIIKVEKHDIKLTNNHRILPVMDKVLILNKQGYGTKEINYVRYFNIKPPYSIKGRYVSDSIFLKKIN